MDKPNPSLTLFQRTNQSANLLVRGLPQPLRKPKVAIICGSGLGGLANTINSDPREEISYHEIPDFPRSTGKSATGGAGCSQIKSAGKGTDQFRNQLDSDDTQFKAMTVNSFLALSARRRPQ